MLLLNCYHPYHIYLPKSSEQYLWNWGNTSTYKLFIIFLLQILRSSDILNAHLYVGLRFMFLLQMSPQLSHQISIIRYMKVDNSTTVNTKSKSTFNRPLLSLSGMKWALAVWGWTSSMFARSYWFLHYWETMTLKSYTLNYL